MEHKDERCIEANEIAGDLEAELSLAEHEIEFAARQKWLDAEIDAHYRDWCKRNGVNPEKP